MIGGMAVCGDSDSLAVLCGGGYSQLLDRACSFLGSMISIYFGFVAHGFRLEASVFLRVTALISQIKALAFKFCRFWF